ncbi:rubrerythrin family protein [Clostridium sp. D2Q-14]|uniref:rubrerythrin family protein n=1 Tax=Anaeromonas gelatinilytica TaxID=2683194 RepID=UPI00193B09C7|nr:rubrerythrin family protein [Anaeromonas gelatinilytica]MBS4534135.1 rubrerythrin family protein [Anaeromonas gelatinilytica]
MLNMNDMTAANLRSAFGGESQAHMRYKVWSDKAEKEGFPNVARLFTAIAYAEEVHASNHFNALGNEEGEFLVASNAGFGVDNTSSHLQWAADGEHFEIHQMYPAYLEVAKMQGEKSAIQSMHYAIEAEKIHEKLYLEAKKAVDKGEDYNVEDIYICDVCGYTAIDGAPDVCPICGARRNKFTAFTK